MIHPMQTRLYCNPASDNTKSHYAKCGSPNAVYNYKMPLGENKVKDYIKEACRQMGYEGGTGHAFRHLAITTNANDPAVSVEQALRFAGHGSVAAQRPYMRVDETSEAAMMGALGIVPLKKEDADKKLAAKEDGADGAI